VTCTVTKKSAAKNCPLFLHYNIYFIFYKADEHHIYLLKLLRGGVAVKDYMRERILEIAEYIIATKATVRQAAKVFGVSKSTVHKDMTERLLEINPEKARLVKEVLEFNKAERHIRGGRATKRKYLNM